MSSYIINGKRPLRGELTISGSKNAALPIVAAAMMLDGPCIIENAPHISDVKVMMDIGRDLGATIHVDDAQDIHIDPRTINTYEATGSRPRKIRASYYLEGAMLSRFNKVKLALPGGCNFGSRPIDLHVKGFEALGAKVEITHGNIEMETDRLVGDHIYLDVASVGATINIMIAATKAEGTTTIENAAREPHVVDTANFLNTMGANIKGAGTDVIRVEGVTSLPGNATYSIIPDQIEAGTYMIAAAATHGDLVCHNVIPKHLEPLTSKMEEMGIFTEYGDDWVRVWTDDGHPFNATTFKTMFYPGFPTDLQPQTVVLLTQANGVSRMFENVWENRFQYVDDLKLMGADITVADRVAIINGPSNLTGATLRGRDLRAGAALAIAALTASGESEVLNAEVIDRGYENFVEKLSSLGADIRKVGDEA